MALALLVGLAVSAAPAGAGGHSRSQTTTTTVVDTGQGGRIIPRPNSGHPPEDAGDRGGSLQILVFFLVLAGTATIALLAFRDSRKAKARATAAAAQR